MTSLNEHDYSDLLGENPDPLQQDVINDLDRAARRFDTVQMPAWKHAIIANAIKAHILKQAPASRRFLLPARRPVKRLSLAGVVALASLSVVLLMGAALPNIVPLEQLLAWLDHTYGNQQGNQQVGKVVNMQQSSCGFTMTVKRLYANPAQMIVAYELDAPNNHSFIGSGDFGPEQYSMSLSDEHGHTFPFTLTSPKGEAALGNDSGQFLSFDISELTNIPKSLALHLAIPQLYGLEVPGSPTTAGCETIDSTKGISTSNPGIQGPPVQGTIIHTAFDFHFTVAVQDGAQVLHLNKTVTSNGTSMTLERVVITPADGTIIYVKDGDGRFITDLVVTANGKRPIESEQRGTDGTDEQLMVFENVPHSQWILTYTSNPAMQGSDKFGRPIPGLKGIQAGPWVFTFTTP